MENKKYFWHCRFTYPNDNNQCYLTEWNDCKTFKELRRYWRKNKPNIKLVSAIKQEIKKATIKQP